MRDKDNYNAYMKDYMLRRYHKRRVDAIILLGGKCKICGSTDELNFHHINPDLKIMAIARMSSLSKQKWEEELAKCELLCEECHQFHHRVFNEHGYKKYFQGCRCNICRAANALYSKEYKLKRKQSKLL